MAHLCVDFDYFQNAPWPQKKVCSMKYNIYSNSTQQMSKRQMESVE